jgi:hypothetical protein
MTSGTADAAQLVSKPIVRRQKTLLQNGFSGLAYNGTELE